MSTTVWIVWKPRRVELSDTECVEGIEVQSRVDVDFRVVDSVHATESAARAIAANGLGWSAEEWQVRA